MTEPTLSDFGEESAPTTERTLTVCHVDEPHDFYGGRARNGTVAMGDTMPPHRGYLGNPHRVSDHGREECIQMFEASFLDHLRDSRAFALAVSALDGNRVACYCRHSDEDEPACHLDVIREALLDGRVFRIALDVHDITLAGWKQEAACDPEVLL